MGSYNPHAPYIIGEEWVPIRQANYVPDNDVERGYTFGLNNASSTVVSGAYYVQDPPAVRSDGCAEFLAVYPAGLENQTGPIKSVVIPASAVGVTGTAASGTLAALLNPSDGLFLSFLAGVVDTGVIGINFDVASYSQQLFGKRILDVRLRYTATGSARGLATMLVSLARLPTTNDYPFQSGLTGTGAGGNSETYSTVSFSDLNVFWQASTDPAVQTRLYPWRYQELANFAASAAAADRIIVMIESGLAGLTASTDNVRLGYAALEVIYCEEQRVLYGGDLMSASGSNSYPISGHKFVQLRNTSLAIPSSPLSAGEYTVVQNHVQLGIVGAGGFPKPILQALRELYELPNQRGAAVSRTTVLESQFTVTGNANVLPHLTLHTTGGIVTGCHAYGLQNDVPVYGTITAIQEIEDDPVGAAASFPQVRFYARRYGDTIQPLRLVDVATGTSTVSISVAEFDALPEIVDGWKEVTLRFATPPSFATAAGDVDWRWDSVSETAGNQWQVLGCDGSTPPAPHTTGPATYYAPVGNTVSLTWMSPTISGTADDPNSDAVLIFSQDPPAVTGFALTTATQALTGISLDCGVPKACIPTGIYCNQLTWDVGAQFDTFTRTEVDGWGTSTSGHAWSVAGGSAGNYDVNGTQGLHALDTTNVTRHSALTSVGGDFDAKAAVTMPVLPTGAAVSARVIGRYSGGGVNVYSARLQFETTGAVSLTIVEIVASVGAVLSTVLTLPATHAAGDKWMIRFRGVGSELMAKAWNVTKAQTEPAAWQVTATDTSLTTGQVGVASRRETGNSNGTFEVAFDDFCNILPALSDGGYVEIERSDSITDWQTIARMTDLCSANTFCDYEARAGDVSLYRIRTVNLLDFYGPWATGSATLPAPGTTGGPGFDGTSVLIFTSNQQPESNLAYPMNWEGTPVEQFAFPEADQVQLQRMFGKDFTTAFRPLERGGERFRRVLLVSAAAIPIPSLGNFHDLRDLAWAQLDYVCVRDELGNRWFATIIVPSGEVRRGRTLYWAQIEVVETTDTAAAVDP